MLTEKFSVNSIIRNSIILATIMYTVYAINYKYGTLPNYNSNGKTSLLAQSNQHTDCKSYHLFIANIIAFHYTTFSKHYTRL